MKTLFVRLLPLLPSFKNKNHHEESQKKAQKVCGTDDITHDFYYFIMFPPQSAYDLLIHK